MNSDFLNISVLTDYEESCTYRRCVDGENLEYEIIFGNGKIVFIKAGAGGSARGYKDKYRKMARRIHEQIGATVICASNPYFPHEEIDEEEIRRVIAEKHLSDFEISFVGVSDGAYHNLSLARRFSETVKWIGINTSYIDVSGLTERLMLLPDVFKLLIYGTKDDDFDDIVPAISKITSEKLALELVEGADHRFTGMLDEFIALADVL